MGFAGEDEDHGTPGVREDLRQPRQIGEDERGALVGRETARETDHKRRLFPFGGGFLERLGRRLLEQIQQDFFLFLLGLPHFGVGDLFYISPLRRLRRQRAPVRAHRRCEQRRRGGARKAV